MIAPQAFHVDYLRLLTVTLLDLESREASKLFNGALHFNSMWAKNSNTRICLFFQIKIYSPTYSNLSY